MTAPYPPFDGTQPCASVDPETFFPPNEHVRGNQAAERAKTVCRSCPFLGPCLTYALHHNVTGVWGGTGTGERKDIRRRSGIQPHPVMVRDWAGPDNRPHHRREAPS